MEAERNTPILAQRIHGAAREGRQPTTEKECPFGGSCEMHVDMGGTNKLGGRSLICLPYFDSDVICFDSNVTCLVRLAAGMLSAMRAARCCKSLQQHQQLDHSASAACRRHQLVDPPLKAIGTPACTDLRHCPAHRHHQWLGFVS